MRISLKIDACQSHFGGGEAVAVCGQDRFVFRLGGREAAVRQFVIALQKLAGIGAGRGGDLCRAAFADDVADPTCDLVVAALILAAEHQAQRLGELLGSLAAAARDQATMRLRVEAGRARTRTSVKVIVGATGAFVLGLALFNRGYLAPYDTAVGQLVLLLVGGVFAIAFVWLSRMTRPASVERFLNESPGLTTPERTSGVAP